MAAPTKRAPLQCWIQTCDDGIRWQMRAKGGFIVGGICQYHKEAWYDKQAKHDTTLVAVDEKGALREMEPEPTQDGVHTKRQPANRPGERAGVDGGPVGQRELDAWDQRSDHQSPAQAHRSRPDPEPTQGETRDVAVLAALPAVGQPGSLRLTDEEKTALAVDPLADEIQIKPNGIVFVSWNYVADVLDSAFSVGEWSLFPDGKPFLDANCMNWQFHLFVHGKWVATAVGEHPDPRNDKMSFANRAESAKSDALVKCSKALGVFRKLWNKAFLDEWKREYAVQVRARQYHWSAKFEVLWRRKDQFPFFEEQGVKGDIRAEGTHTRDFDDDARDHIASINQEERLRPDEIPLYHRKSDE